MRTTPEDRDDLSARLRGLGTARERGAATIEHLGTIVIVTLLFGAAVLGFSTYGPHLERALCQFATGMGMSAGSCAGAPGPTADDGPTDEDFRPPVCMLQETSTQVNSEFTIGFVTIGDNAGFVVQRNSDGTVQVTASDGGGLGVEGGFGGSVGGRDSGLGADVNFGAGVKLKVGDTWQFEDWDAWTAMKNDLDAYLAQQEQIKNAGEAAAGLHLWLWLSDGYLDEPQAPEQTATTMTLDAAVGGQFGLRDVVPAQDGGDDELFDPNVGVYAEGAFSNSVVRTENHRTGEVSETFSVTLSGEAGGNGLFLNAGAAGEVKGAYRITYGADGTVTQVQFMRESAGGVSVDMGGTTPGDHNGSASLTGDANDRTVITTALAVTDENRDVVDSWIAANNASAAAGGPALIPPNAYNPSTPVPDNPFSDLLYDEALSSHVVYDNVADGWSFGAEFALGLKVGASFGSEEKTATVQEANFLGGPGQDGVRPMVDFDTCVME